jgi:hypothetical protein
VSGVQRAHCGDEADDAIFGARLPRVFFHPGYGSDDFHGESRFLSKTTHAQKQLWVNLNIGLFIPQKGVMAQSSVTDQKKIKPTRYPKPSLSTHRN